MIVKIKEQKGQTLIAIVAMMLLALTIGFSISSRFISRLKSFTRTDDAAKAQGVAEAAVERILLLPSSTLENYIQFNTCGSNCLLQITDVNGQKITATVSLSYAGDTSNAFLVDLSTTDSYQLDLNSYPTGHKITVCWDTPASVYASYIYDNSGTIAAQQYAYNAAGSEFFGNGFSQAASAFGHQNCFDVSTINTPIILRLRGFYLNSKVSIYPDAGSTIPKQGIVIASVGKAGTSVRTVSVLKTSAIAPAIFDFAIYQRSGSDPLSNVSL